MPARGCDAAASHNVYAKEAISVTRIAFVIPCYRSAETIAGVAAEIEEVMQTRNGYEHRVVLVNDGSPDRTLDVLRALAMRPGVTAIDLAKNFGQHSAVLAGIEEARRQKADIVVCLDDDGQTPADEVFSLIDALDEGYDVVYARYEVKRHSPLRNLGSWCNEMLSRLLLKKPRDLYISSYFAMRRFVADELVRYHNSFPYLAGLILRATHNIGNVTVNHRRRAAGRSGYTLGRLIALWLNGFTAFSVLPLRVSMLLGIISALFGFGLGLYAVINKFLSPDVPMGWTTTVAAVSLIGGMILLVLGMIGEYVGRIYISISNSPQYVIRRRYGRREESSDKHGEHQRSENPGGQ